jgi:hypothetical protein
VPQVTSAPHPPFHLRSPVLLLSAGDELCYFFLRCFAFLSCDSRTLGDKPEADEPSGMDVDSAPEGDLSPFALPFLPRSSRLILRLPAPSCFHFEFPSLTYLTEY